MKARACKAAGNEGEGVQGLVFFDLVEEYGAGGALGGAVVVCSSTRLKNMGQWQGWEKTD